KKHHKTSPLRPLFPRRPQFVRRRPADVTCQARDVRWPHQPEPPPSMASLRVAGLKEIERPTRSGCQEADTVVEALEKRVESCRSCRILRPNAHLRTRLRI